MLDDPKAQLSDIESVFHLLVGQVSGSLSGLDASAYHQLLLTFLVGIGLIRHSFWLFLAIIQVNIEALFLPSVSR
jgi:hypothetical protein